MGLGAEESWFKAQNKIDHCVVELILIITVWDSIENAKLNWNEES